MKRSFIVSFEGGEACGKSTQIKLFTDYLESKKIDYIAIREPGGTAAGEQIRQIFLNPFLNICPKTETLLLNAARAQLIEDVVKPAIREGKVIVFDRYFDSNLVYQGYSLGENPDKLMPVIDFAISNIVPNLTIVLNQPAQISYERKLLENKQDRIEQRGIEYYEKIETGFLQLAKNSPERIKVIDAVGTIEEVHNRIINVFEENYNA